MTTEFVTLPGSLDDFQSGEILGEATLRMTKVTVIMTTQEVEFRTTPKTHHVEIIQDAFENLLQRIDYLPYETELALGHISDDQFEVIADNFLTQESIPPEELINKIKIIYPYIKNKERLGSELFSTLFKSEITAAQDALLQIVSKSSTLSMDEDSRD